MVRAFALAGLAAGSAAVAHGGAAALTTPAWSLAALVGAAIAVTALLRLAGAARQARAEADAVWLGSSAPANHDPLPLAETAAIMLAAQGAAHGALLAAGAGAHTGPGGSVALHVALALLGALLVWSADRTLAAALAGLGAALAAAIELLLRLAAPRPPAAAAAPAGRPPPTGRRGRAPPALA
jgi:hypothetical protein